MGEDSNNMEKKSPVRVQTEWAVNNNKSVVWKLICLFRKLYRSLTDITVTAIKICFGNVGKSLTLKLTL